MTFRQKMRALRCLIHIWMEQQNIEDEMFYAFYPPDDLPDMYHRAQSQTYWERLEWALEKLELKMEEACATLEYYARVEADHFSDFQYFIGATPWAYEQMTWLRDLTPMEMWRA